MLIERVSKIEENPKHPTSGKRCNLETLGSVDFGRWWSLVEKLRIRRFKLDSPWWPREIYETPISFLCGVKLNNIGVQALDFGGCSELSSRAAIFFSICLPARHPTFKSFKVPNFSQFNSPQVKAQTLKGLGFGFRGFQRSASS